MAKTDLISPAIATNKPAAQNPPPPPGGGRWRWNDADQKWISNDPKIKPTIQVQE